jgi:large subunit ribosomal protein L19
MDLIEYIERELIRTDVPDFRPGDKVKVHVKITEGDKERIQVFEGVVIRKRKGGAGASFTVRKNSYGVDVERIFPLHSPSIDKVVLVSKGSVRRSRLYYLRRLHGKAARIKEKKATQQHVSS